MCSQSAVTVVITDECPGGICSGAGKIHFDLSGTAFSDMASPGTSLNLLNAGVVSILFQRYIFIYSYSLSPWSQTTLEDQLNFFMMFVSFYLIEDALINVSF